MATVNNMVEPYNTKAITTLRKMEQNGKIFGNLSLRNTVLAIQDEKQIFKFDWAIKSKQV